jgi:hypothetical protein
MNSQTESIIKSVQSAAAAMSAPLNDVKDDVLSGARRAQAQLVVRLDDAIKELQSSKNRRIAIDRARRIGTRTSETVANHPIIVAGVVAGACYLLARRLWQRAKPVLATPARARRVATPRRKRAAAKSPSKRNSSTANGTSANSNAQGE